MKISTWRTVLLILLVLSLAGCSKNKTKLVATYTNPAFNGTPMQQVLVIGVMNNGVNRHVYEDTFVDALKANGVDAIPSHSVMPKFEDFTDRASFIAAIDRAGCDHVLLAVLMDTKKYSSSSVTLDNHFQRSYTDLRRPRSQNKLTVKLETTIYRAATKERLWAGNTKSFDPDSVQIILDGNTKIIMNSLKKFGLLP